MALGGRPTLQTLTVLAAVFVLQQVAGLLGRAEYVLFYLDAAVAARPWAAVSHVYAHSDPGHLLANVLALALAGPLVARTTTTARFHLFFVVTGAVAGLAEVFCSGLLGPSAAVVGASGAVFCLFGYVLTGNAVAAGLLDRLALPARIQFLLFAAVAVLVTLATASPRAALVGHAVGLLCGLGAGRVRLLDVGSRRT